MKGIMGTAMSGGEDAYSSFMRYRALSALTAMSGAVEGGLVPVQERLPDIVKECFVAPSSRMSVLMGNALSTVTKSLLRAVIILILGIIMGTLISQEPLGWLGGLVLICGFALGFARIGFAVAPRANSAGI